MDKATVRCCAVVPTMAMVFVGCHPGSHTAGGPTASVAQTATVTVAPVDLTSESPLTARIHEIAGRLAPERVSLAGIVANGFITHGAVVTTPLDLPAGRCVSIVALASSGVRDLDAHLYAPDGELMAEDVETDAHPTVQFCTTEARRVYHVIEAYEGEGAYVVASFVTDRAGLDAVARVVGGHPGTTANTAAGHTGPEQRLTALREGIARRGFVPSGEIARAGFDGAGATRFPLSVTPDKCYTLAAFVDGHTADTNLAVYDPDGDVIARDVRGIGDAFVQFCPPAPANLSVEVSAFGLTGAGAVYLQAFTADASTVGGANTLWLGERLAWAASARPLQEVEPDVLQGLHAMGYAQTVARESVTLAPSEAHDLAFTPAAGRCTAVAAIAGRGLGRLGVDVFNPAGDRVGVGASRDGATVAVVCPAESQRLRAEITADVGTGASDVVVVQGVAPPAWAADVDPVAVSRALSNEWTARPLWAVVGAPEKIVLGAGAERTRAYDRPAGRCVRFGVSAGATEPWVTVSLHDAVGAILVEATGHGSAMVTRCGDNAEHVRMTARTDPPSAPVSDAVLTRWERPTP